jgi:hypothetical protein
MAQVAWPLELIIDSNAIKQYNQVYLNTGSPYDYGDFILMSKEIVSQFCFESVFSFDHRRTFAVQL